MKLKPGKPEDVKVEWSCSLKYLIKIEVKKMPNNTTWSNKKLYVYSGRKKEGCCETDDSGIATLYISENEKNIIGQIKLACPDGSLIFCCSTQPLLEDLEFKNTENVVATFSPTYCIICGTCHENTCLETTIRSANSRYGGEVFEKLNPVKKDILELDSVPTEEDLKKCAEHSLRLMLHMGEVWIDQKFSCRAVDKNKDKYKSEDQIADYFDQFLPISTYKLASYFGGLGVKDKYKIKEITKENLMTEFIQNLKKGAEYAACDSLEEISKNNLNALVPSFKSFLGVKKEIPTKVKEIVKQLKKIDLVCTHYSEEKHQKELNSAPHSMLMSLHRLLHLLPGYKKTKNTPSMSVKRIGHFDYVYFAVEPKNPKNNFPFKTQSRFGENCHMVNFEDLPDYSMMALGDVAIKNCTIHPETIEKILNDGGYETYKNWEKNLSSEFNKEGKRVRKFATCSEMLFIKEHVQLALALSVCNDLLNLKSSFCLKEPEIKNDKDPYVNLLEIALAPENYNALITSMFRPEVMVPHVAVLPVTICTVEHIKDK